MFTGLIQQMGTVRGRQAAAHGERLVIDCPGWDRKPALGDSVAVDGCCLTVAGVEDGLAFDVVPETLRLTTLGSLSPGRRVHLEAAAMPTTLLGGHIVQGHVDGVGRVGGGELKVGGNERRLRIAPPRALLEFFAPKGSVCLQGVSLTLAGLDVAGGWFEVALIPTTLEKTTLGELKAGDGVNIECDVIAKQVVQWVREFGR